MRLLTEYAEIEELAGGQARQTIGIKPIAYRRNGNLTRITNLLGASGDPNLPLGTDELCQFRVRDRLAGNSPLAHFGKGKSHIKWTWLGTNNVTGQPSDNTQLFRNAWNGADLRLAIAGHILHDDAPLYTGHPRSFSFRLDAHQNFDPDTLSSDEFRILDPILIAPSGLDNIPLSWAKSVQGGKTVLTVTLPDGDYAGWTLDPTITLQPDATAGFDNYIYNLAATTNYGTDTDVYIGDINIFVNSAARSPVKFALGSIPVNAIISSTTFSLYEIVAVDDAGGGSWAVGLRRLLRDWSESQSTWNVYSTGNSWTTAGAGSNGNDRAASDSATLTLDGTAASAFVSWSGATLTDDVQKMVNGTYSNYGWLVQAPTAENQGASRRANQFPSSDNATPANRPKLEVEYVMPRRGMLHFQGWRRV